MLRTQPLGRLSITTNARPDPGQDAIEPDEHAALLRREQVKKHERAAARGGRWIPLEPGSNTGIGIRAQGPEGRLPDPDAVDDLGRPESDHDVGHRREPTDPELVSQHRREVVPLGVEAAGDLLQIREARAVLDVQEPRRLHGPGKDVGASGELVVLIWMVDGDPIAQRGKLACLELAHGRMDEVRTGALATASCADGADVEGQSQDQRQTGVDIQ